MLISVGKLIGSAASVEEAEARAASVGMQALAGIYRGPMVLEVDCMALVNELKKGLPESISLFWCATGYHGGLGEFYFLQGHSR